MQSKTAAPTLPSAVLYRESLIRRLQEIVIPGQSTTLESSPHYKLILLCAPAGYGKTTLLADFAYRTGIPCCWYFLSPSDTDRYTFLTTLLACIRHRFPHFGNGLDLILSDDNPSPEYNHDIHRFEMFVDALTQAVEKEITERFVLILCNYHTVDESSTITNLVNRLLEKLPPQCVLLIESRSTPSIEFAPLLACREAIGWNSSTLRINAQEIQELARVQGVAPLENMEAEQLATAFDGWIAGILLGTRLGDAGQFRVSNRTGILQGLPSMRVEREKLFAYLVNEIFKSQPAVYNFLKEASVLQQMTPGLCDALLKHTVSSQYLKYLLKQGMFVSCSDSGPELLYTCHPVLRELLCEELQRISPERFVELHLRASVLFETAHDYENAITHALTAGGNDRAAQLIIRARQEMYSRRYSEILLRWIDALPPKTTEMYPELLLIRATIYLMSNQYADALPLLDTASALHATTSCTAVEHTYLPHMQAELMLLRSKALFQEGRYQEAQHLCKHILEVTPMDEVFRRAEAHACLGSCASLQGDLTGGVEHLQKALQLWGRNTVRFQTAEAHSALANTYNLMGNFALTEHHLSRAITCWEQLRDEKGKASNLLRMGVNKHHQGLFAEASALLKQVATSTHERPGFEREEAYALANLGAVYQDQGFYNQSLQSLEPALELARTLKDNYLLNDCLCHLAMTYLFMGDASTSLLLLSECHLPPMSGESMSYERAVHDLTRGLILIQQHRYDEAYGSLRLLEASLQKNGMKRELLRANLYLAACEVALQKQPEALHSLEEIGAILQVHDYGQFVLAWLGRFPEVFKLIKTHPALTQLCTLLHIEHKGVTIKKGKTREIASPQPAGASQQSTLKVQALGEPAVFVNDHVITRWRMARSMELFFYLLDCGRPVRKEQIITALWPEVDEQINQTFHSTVHYLRKALADGAIVSHGGAYSLNLSALATEVVYDVAVFKQEYTQAKQLLASEDEEQAKVVFLSMVELYQGDYAQPFYSDWCTFRRDELRRMYLETCSHIAQIAWKQEEFEESAVHWQHMLAIDSCLEEAHYGLMKYYARTGRRGAALRQYQRCAETLQEELSVHPSVAIQSFYHRLNGSTETTRKTTKTPQFLEEKISHGG